MARPCLLVAFAAALTWPSKGEAATNVLRKCCPAGEQLNKNMSCVAVDASKESAGLGTSERSQGYGHDDWELMPSELVLLDSDSLKNVSLDELRSTDAAGHRRYELHVEPGAGLPCESDDVTFYRWDDAQLFTNGSLRVIQAQRRPSTIPHDGGPEGEDEHFFLFHSSTFCMDSVKSEHVKHIIVLCPCADAVCVRKCCSPYEVMVVGGPQHASCNETAYVVPELHYDWHPDQHRHSDYTDTDRVPYLLHGLPHCSPTVQPILLLSKNIFNSSKKSQFWILPDGSARAEMFGWDHPLPPGSFCGDVMADYDSVPTAPRFAANLYFCGYHSITTSPWSTLIQSILAPSGAAFLAITLLMQACLPKLRRSLHSWNLLAHNGSLFVAYIALAVNAMAASSLSPAACQSLAFILQSSFLASFFWLNVLCLDIAWTFSGIRPPLGNAAMRRHKKLRLYSLYAWGCTAVVTGITATLNYGTDPETQRFNPKMGVFGCWFKEKTPALLFFYGPISVLLLANVILFVLTMRSILAARRKITAVLHAGHTAGHRTGGTTDMQRLVVNGKLFGLMGLSWVTEVIAFFVGGRDYYWHLPDVINLLRAVFIFIIVCCKKEVLQLFVRRLTGSKTGSSSGGGWTSISVQWRRGGHNSSGGRAASSGRTTTANSSLASRPDTPTIRDLNVAMERNSLLCKTPEEIELKAL